MKKGFTLVEIMIVIMIIAILIGISLGRFRGMHVEGKITKARGELGALETAVASYYAHYSRTYPADGELTNIESAVPLIVGKVPDDPFNPGNIYGYDLSANGDYYVIYAKGTSGTTASIADTGVVTESDLSIIYVSNGSRDTQP